MIPVLLAGGLGERLWPLSTREKPKPFLHLLSPDETLLQATARRAAMATSHPPLVVTSIQHAPLAAEQLPDCDILAEPCMRNTAAAVTMAVLRALEQSPDPLLLILPTDHWIGQEPLWAGQIQQARAAAEEGRIATFGITPSAPSPAYGYLLAEEQQVRFIEKPETEHAATLIATGNAFWNSGIFLFSAKTFLEEMAEHAPQLLQACQYAWGKRETHGGAVCLVSASYERIPALPIDRALMERSGKLAMLPARFGWSDLGSLETLEKLAENNEYAASLLKRTAQLA